MVQADLVQQMLHFQDHASASSGTKIMLQSLFYVINRNCYFWH